MIKLRIDVAMEDRLMAWIADLRKASGRIPRRYATLEDAYERMQTENQHLSEAQARHLTIHGSNQNEDGTYSWKFDNYVRAFPPIGIAFEDQYKLYQRISCPTLLVRGTESWASNPEKDGRARYFQEVEVANIEKAGHWVHHDQLDIFLQRVRAFLAD
jgi:pimeloyl-ACP methyl ester carboxylesterase